jgi:hypothetical protein
LDSVEHRSAMSIQSLSALSGVMVYRILPGPGRTFSRGVQRGFRPRDDRYYILLLLGLWASPVLQKDAPGPPREVSVR